VISQEQARGREFESVDVRVKDLLSLENIRKEVESWGLTTFAIVDEMKRIQEAFMILEVILSVLGAIALVVASLGIGNVLVMSVLERRRVIGIMKAIGGTDGDVRRIFLVEASLIGLLGGLLGLLAGWALTRAASVMISSYFARNGFLDAPELFAYPWWLLAGAIAFAVLFSLVSGVLPANRAARIDPVEALRL
jgi:putative ABC transport system permease protein